VNTASYHHELQIILPRCFCEDERFESLSSMINITEIVSKRFPINDDFAVTLDHKHLSLTTFSPRPAIELVWDFFRFFYFLEFIGCLFEREVLELKLRIDNFVGEVILVYFFFVFVENCKIIKIRMPVKIERHFVETKLKFSSR
jgi:hypothetical protein